MFFLLLPFSITDREGFHIMPKDAEAQLPYTIEYYISAWSLNDRIHTSTFKWQLLQREREPEGGRKGGRGGGEDEVREVKERKKET